MLTAFGDELQIKEKQLPNEIEAKLYLGITMSKASSPTWICLRKIVPHELSQFLTRCIFATKFGVFEHDSTKLEFASIDHASVFVDLLGLPSVDINSTEEEKQLYLQTLVANINTVALQVHSIVPPVEIDEDWTEIN